MRLKSVRIYGFKTFAERTEFSLEGGIVAVVGPNGCGKSNLVDAILWGLGEANARHLRANNSQEVIFSGSARRKGVGYCEVDLLFDNEDRLLPIESPEVLVSRRLSRSGDSDYSINRRSCRQRDIFELLADSGLGRTGYAIIGQRQIDSALSASSDERRAWIDEAAGVQRYRHRKVEALRKLDSAKEHLQRVADILTELDSQREPLREQAEQAADYRRVQNALRETETTFLMAEAIDAQREQARLKEQIDVATRLVASETFRTSAHESRIVELAQEVATIEQSIDAERANEHREQTAVAKAKADIRLFETKLEALTAQESSYDADREAIALRIEEAENELEKCREDLRHEEDSAAEIRNEASGSTEETRILSLELDEAERQLRQAVQREAQRARRQVQREHAQEKRQRAERELKSLVSGLEEVRGNALEAKGAVDAQVSVLEEFKDQVKRLLAEELSLKGLEDRQAADLRASMSERAALEGRERGIEETLDALEGMSQGARAVLEAARHGALPGEYVSVGQTFQTDKRFALAIETALGGAVNDLIVDTERESKEAIEYLKERRAGRATFQPIILMRQNNPSPELHAILRQSGVIEVASELCSCSSKYLPVLNSLLGRTLIVENLTVGLRLAKTRGWSKMATLEGEMIHSSGAVTGGAQARQGYGAIQRKAELSQLRKQIDALDAKVDEFHSASKGRQDKAVKIGLELKSVREQLAEQDELLSEAKSFHRTLEDELKSTLRDKDRLERELAEEIPALEAEPIAIAEFEEKRDAAIRALATKSADAKFMEERLKESEKRLGQTRQRLETAKRRRDQELSSEQIRAKKAEGVVPERIRLADAILKEGAHLQQRELKAEASAQSLSFLRKIKEQRQAEKETEQNQAAASRQSLKDAGDSLHQAELNRTRAEARKFAALSRLVEEYSIAESEIPLDGVTPPPPDAPAVIGRLKRELRAMGDVNLGAIEAFERLTLRYEDLNSQREDILGGIAEVEKSVAELDLLTRERFLTTFANLKKTFSETFGKLFEGGVGSIGLTDEQDVLSSGIEIEVTLPGKKRQPLNLLSGGEQSLCTAAFLFSLLQVKPSPLVVLDEVDAPLDGRNVERYAALLKQLSRTMQFIVITHNPVTIEVADTWLGVTMQEPGVSSLILTKVPSALHSDVKSA